MPAPCPEACGEPAGGLLPSGGRVHGHDLETVVESFAALGHPVRERLCMPAPCPEAWTDCRRRCGVRSTIAVTYRSPNVVCRHTCSSTSMCVTASYGPDSDRTRCRARASPMPASSDRPATRARDALVGEHPHLRVRRIRTQRHMRSSDVHTWQCNRTRRTPSRIRPQSCSESATRPNRTHSRGNAWK